MFTARAKAKLKFSTRKCFGTPLMVKHHPILVNISFSMLLMKSLSLQKKARSLMSIWSRSPISKISAGALVCRATASCQGKKEPNKQQQKSRRSETEVQLLKLMFALKTRPLFLTGAFSSSPSVVPSAVR